HLLFLDLLQGPAEHAVEAIVAVDDPRVRVGDDDGRIGGVGHQRQPPEMVLAGQLHALALGHVGRRHHDVGDHTLPVAYGGIQGFQPAAAAVAAHAFDYPGELVAVTQRLPHGAIGRSL